MPEPRCWGEKDKWHKGPFVWCGWSTPAGKRSRSEHVGWLCEPCERFYGAFRFPEQKQQEKRKELENASTATGW